MNREEILELVFLERDRQDEKWGANRRLDDRTWLTILVEEVGETARACLNQDPVNLKEELVQCLAVIFAWMESK